MASSKTYPVKSVIRDVSYLKSMEEYEAMYEKSIKEPSKFWLDAA
jgi:hypothetical protein